MNFRQNLKKQLKQLTPERLIVFRAVWQQLERQFKAKLPPRKRHRLAWLVLAGSVIYQVYHWDLVNGEWVINHHSQTYYVKHSSNTSDK